MVDNKNKNDNDGSSSYRQKQVGVAKGMAAAATTVVLGYTATIIWTKEQTGKPSEYGIAPMKYAMQALFGPAVCLLLSIGRIASHRFFSSEDIDGSGLTTGTPKVKLLNALLQNTLEQTALAVPVYLASGVTLEDTPLALLPVTASLCFVIGRLFFVKGYRSGAPARAYGFAMTFYSTASLCFLNLGTIAWKLAGGKVPNSI